MMAHPYKRLFCRHVKEQRRALYTHASVLGGWSVPNIHFLSNKVGKTRIGFCFCGEEWKGDRLVQEKVVTVAILYF